jgi:hypothetical protein
VDTYLVVHNREGGNRAFSSEITQKLKRLVANGRVKRAELWDRQMLLSRCCDRIEDILTAGLRDHATYLLGHFQRLFDFGRFYLPEVPVVESRLRFERGAPCTMTVAVPRASRDIRRLLLSPTKARWTLVTGAFGSGKTTSVLHAATSSESVILLVPCAVLSELSFRHSTNVVFEEVVKVLGALGEFDNIDKEIYDEFGGAVLHRLLKVERSPYLLVLDGLDENSAFSNLRGLQQLSNQLAGLKCPIIMTTRREHLDAMFGDFSFAFDELSTKLGRHRHARLLQLDQWEPEHVVRLVDQIVARASGTQKRRFLKFHDLLETGEYFSLYGQLPLHPLFLQFILEDISLNGPRPAARCTLIREWVERKIRRDRVSWAPEAIVTRPLPRESIDLGDFVDRMARLLERAAFLMTRPTSEGVELSESLDWASVRDEANRLFGPTDNPELLVLLNSVLIAQSHRVGAEFKVTFALRIFHEYFLASYLVANDLTDSGFPDSVRALYSEIRRASQ